METGGLGVAGLGCEQGWVAPEFLFADEGDLGGPGVAVDGRLVESFGCEVWRDGSLREVLSMADRLALLGFFDTLLNPGSIAITQFQIKVHYVNYQY
jgi:hypothetical protein